LDTLTSISSVLNSYHDLHIEAETGMTFEQFKRRRNGYNQISNQTVIKKSKKLIASKRATVTLVIVSFTYVALNLPHRVLEFVAYLKNYHIVFSDAYWPQHSNGSSLPMIHGERLARASQLKSALDEVCENLASFSFTVNFLLYVVFAQKFRHALHALFLFAYFKFGVLFNKFK
jgi:hypothetical protein